MLAIPPRAADTSALNEALKGKQIDAANVEMLEGPVGTASGTILLTFRDGSTLRIRALGSVTVELLD